VGLARCLKNRWRIGGELANLDTQSKVRFNVRGMSLSKRIQSDLLRFRDIGAVAPRLLPR
jgi:hypothetical protein